MKLHLQVDSDTLSQCTKLITANYTVTYLFIFLFTNGLVIAEALRANVKQVFMRYNTPIPSSAPVERLLSVAWLVRTAKRNRMSDHNVMFETLVLLKVNLLCWRVGLFNNLCKLFYVTKLKKWHLNKITLCCSSMLACHSIA